jgi:hypothetical protein
MDTKTQQELLNQLKNPSSNLSLGIKLTAVAANLHRVRKHYRRGNYKRMAYYGFVAGEFWGAFSKQAAERLGEHIANRVLDAEAERLARSFYGMGDN